jgi:hypothetical protein
MLQLLNFPELRELLDGQLSTTIRKPGSVVIRIQYQI